jgi:hypothetical protein
MYQVLTLITIFKISYGNCIYSLILLTWIVNVQKLILKCLSLKNFIRITLLLGNFLNIVINCSNEILTVLIEIAMSYFDKEKTILYITRYHLVFFYSRWRTWGMHWMVGSVSMICLIAPMFLILSEKLSSFPSLNINGSSVSHTLHGNLPIKES